MKFNLGDFVRFVDEKREGYITRIIDSETLGVTDTDGFEIPVHSGNLTHVHGQGKQAATEVPVETPVSAALKIAEEGIFLILTEDKKAGQVVHFNLFNNTGAQLLISLKTLRDKVYAGEFSGVIQHGGMQKIYAASMTDLNIWPEFIFHVIYHHQGNTEPIKPLVIVKKFRAKDFEHKKEIPAVGGMGWQIRLDSPLVNIDPQKLKESFFKAPAIQQQVPRPLNEVDLHLQQLRDDHQFIDSGASLKIQLEHFQKNLDAAIVHHLPSIIFIHGVGNGVLQNQIHKILGRHPQVRTFKDALKEKFGYGATEVFFK